MVVSRINENPNFKIQMPCNNSFYVENPFFCNKIFTKADLPFDICFRADILQAKLVFTDKHNGKNYGSIIQETLENFN